jgi:hypothetical protein
MMECSSLLRVDSNVGVVDGVFILVFSKFIVIGCDIVKFKVYFS